MDRRELSRGTIDLAQEADSVRIAPPFGKLT